MEVYPEHQCQSAKKLPEQRLTPEQTLGFAKDTQLSRVLEPPTETGRPCLGSESSARSSGVFCAFLLHLIVSRFEHVPKA